jgi:hypothetical protein
MWLRFQPEDTTEKAMKISVGSRSSRSGNEPHRLRLGRCSLLVTAVLERHDEGETRVFDVRVLDGRRFVVRCQPGLEQWELVAAYGRPARRQPQGRRVASVLRPLLAVLSRKARQIARRAGKPKCDLPPSTLPSGGAPA